MLSIRWGGLPSIWLIIRVDISLAAAERKSFLRAGQELLFFGDGQLSALGFSGASKDALWG